MYKSAIESSDYLTMSETIVLMKIIDLEENNISLLNPREIKNDLNLSHTAIYNAINKLKAKGIITQLNVKKNCYRINEESLDYLYKLSKKI